jgi:hypothetical protein
MPNDLAKLKRIMRQANRMTNQHPANGNKAYAMRAAWEIEKIRDYLRTGLVAFSYAKVNGDCRTALGTTNPLLIPADKMPRRTEDEEFDVSYKERLGIITYYDLDKDGWRSFYIYSLNQIDHVWPFNYDVFLGQKSHE